MGDSGTADTGLDAASAGDGAVGQPAVQRLESELIGTRAELKAAVGALESANEALRASEERYRALADNARDLITRFDRDLRYQYVNPAVVHQTGIPAEATLGRTVGELGRNAEFSDAWNDRLRHVLETGEPLRFEWEGIGGRWYDVQLSPESDDGAIVSVLSIARDITAQKHAQDALRESEAQYRTLFSAMAEGYALHELICDAEGRPADYRFLAVNPAFERLTGLRAEDVVGRTVKEVIPEVEPIWIERYGRVALTGEPDQFESYAGTLGRWYEVHASRVAPGLFTVIFLDITERRRAEEALRESEERLRLFIDHAPASLAMFDRDMRYVSASRRWLADYRLEDQDLRGRSHYEVFPEIGEEWKRIHRRALSGKVVRAEADPFVRADGSVQWLQWEVRPWRDAAGHIGGIVVFSEDTTDRTRTEQALRDSERHFRLLHETMLHGIVYQDADGTIRSMNPAARRILGAREDELLGRTSIDLEGGCVREDGSPFPAVEHPAMVALRSGEAVRGVVMGVYNPIENRHRWLDVTAVPLFREGEAAPDRVYTLFDDITERRLATGALRRYELLANHSRDIVLFVRLGDGRLLEANAAALSVYGYSRVEMLTLSILDLRAPLTRPLAGQQMALADARGLLFETVHRRKDGTTFPVEVSSRGATVDGTRALISIVRDITERKRTEEGLRAANLRLAEADRRKNEFLAVLSHELRNPLAPIRYSLHLLERVAPGSEPARRALEIIGRQTGQLARLVDDLLDVTRISRSKIQLQRHHVELNQLVRRTVEDHRALFEEKAITLEVSLATEGLPIDGDEARLAQVIGNLLQNAAKFTPSGGQVHVATTAAASRGRATLRVSDTGVGIDPAMLRRLFQPFMQADMTLDRTKGGLGLGLALVKGLVEMHGGEVCAHSDGPGKGAEFVIELPLDPMVAAEGDAPPAPAGSAARRVLVIEDNVDAAASLRGLLEVHGHAVEVVHTGPDGLARARQVRPDLVLCDIGLPGMDGFEVARAFRTDRTFDGVVLVALSGYALPEDLRRALDAGFQQHMAKPPSIEKLERLLADLPAPRGE